MKQTSEQHDVYIIPPNFIEGGTVLGGILKLRNTIEAGILAVITIVPIFQIPMSLTGKIVIACLTTLPLCLFALIGIYGESLSSFVLNYLRF